MSNKTFNIIYYLSKFKADIEGLSSKINNETASVYLKLFIYIHIYILLSRTEEEKEYRLYCHLLHNYRRDLLFLFFSFLYILTLVSMSLSFWSHDRLSSEGAQNHNKANN